MAAKDVEKLSMRLDALCMENQLTRARLDRLEAYKASLEKTFDEDVELLERRTKQIADISRMIQAVVHEGELR